MCLVNKKKMFFFDSFAKPISFYSREYWENLAKKLNVKFTYVQQRSLQSKITYTCGSWCLLYLYNKSRNEIEKTDKYRIINEKFKRKINNDIKFKKKMLNKFGDNIKSIYNKECCKEKDQKCCNFIDGFYNKKNI